MPGNQHAGPSSTFAGSTKHGGLRIGAVRAFVKATATLGWIATAAASAPNSV